MAPCAEVRCHGTDWLCIAYIMRDVFRATYHVIKIFQAFSLNNFAHGSKVTRERRREKAWDRGYSREGREDRG